MLLKRIAAENMRDMFEERIGLTFEGERLAFDGIDFDTTEGIRFATSLFRALEGEQKFVQANDNERVRTGRLRQRSMKTINNALESFSCWII